MRRLLVTALFIGTASVALAQTKEPIALRDIGSFHLGGRYVDISGKPTREVTIGGATQTLNPNGTYLVEQMYVQYLLPQNRKGKVPLLMWHGGGFTGVTYESTPDGREGWLNLFVRKGWDSYVSDAVERGRAGWAMPEVFAGDPVFLTIDAPWVTWRFGAPRPMTISFARLCRAGPRPTMRSRRLTTSLSTGSAPACCWCTASPARSATRPRSSGPTRLRRW